MRALLPSRRRRRAPSVAAHALAAILAVVGVALLAATGAQTAPAGGGVHTGASGLPVPRFVSLKADRVNVRAGPGSDYRIAWVFTRPGLPVEIIQEFDNWRRIRDSDGQVGWVFQSLLAGQRTAVVAPWASGDPRPIRASASPEAAISAYLQPGVLATIDRCAGGWCRLSGARFRGWIAQDQLWGVYPGEEVN